MGNYVCFIDFKRAFDLIDRNTLWLTLKKKRKKKKEKNVSDAKCQKYV